MLIFPAIFLDSFTLSMGENAFIFLMEVNINFLRKLIFPKTLFIYLVSGYYAYIMTLVLFLSLLIPLLCTRKHSKLPDNIWNIQLVGFIFKPCILIHFKARIILEFEPTLNFYIFRFILYRIIKILYYI